MKHKKIILGAAAVTTGLSAGLFFAFAAAINPAVSRLGDKEYITAMQNINRDIQNPAFFAVFFGAALLLPAAAWLYKKSPDGKAFKLIAVSSVLYIAGTVGVTMAANVPLNEQLDTVKVSSASSSQLATARTEYESTWNNWHLVRTIASAAALTAVVAACVSASSNGKSSDRK